MSGSKAAQRKQRLKRTAQGLGVSEQTVRELRRRHAKAVKEASQYPKRQRAPYIAAAMGLTETQLRRFLEVEAAPVPSASLVSSPSRSPRAVRAPRRRPTRVPGPLGPIPPPSKKPIGRSRVSQAATRASTQGAARRRQAPSIEVCPSCGKPIKSTGKCGCL